MSPVYNPPDALSRLRRGGTEVRLSAAVKEVGKDYVLLSSGERLPCGLVVWYVRDVCSCSSLCAATGPLGDTRTK